jgi:DNA mismatch endonuclease (patch repair protein)
MRANPGRDTRPERALRSAVHALGLRYRVNVRPVTDVRRTADLVFTRAKVAVFLDGCFWHGCAEHYRPAKGATSGFWNDKIAGNRRRDADTDERLRQAGWEVVRVWEHEDPADAASRIAGRVKNRRSPSSHSIAPSSETALERSSTAG